MIEGIYIPGTGDLTAVNELRLEVFQKELGIPPQIERDGLDRLSMYALAFENSIPAAAGRLLYDGDAFWISRIAVKWQFRGSGYGDFIARMLINKAMLSGAGEIFASALESSLGFFERLGFEVCAESFESSGQVYVPMWQRTETVRTCCSCGE